MKQICALLGCGKEFSNWRRSCCCNTHQQQYAGQKSHKDIVPRKLVLNEDEKAERRNEKIIYHRIKAMERQAKIKNATPPWADKDKIKDLYKTAHLLELNTGLKHEVDHIIPLRGKTVSGLHVETNMQILLKTENRHKGNSFQ